ncbi:MAG: tRNA pseudouridine(38-40) synthase TruA [Pseudomonadota bacterium]
MTRVAMVVEYDGTRYCGWQHQRHCEAVQAVVERAISKVANHDVRVHCAGRTDTGVHATGQVIHFDTTAVRTERSWLLGTNSQLPNDVSMSNAAIVSDRFHARYDALERQYRYLINNAVRRHAVFRDRAMVVHEPLTTEPMQAAADHLLGEHDFSAFRAAGCQAHHPNRSVRAIRVQRAGEWIIVDIAANAFLHHMVRNIVGLLIYVGSGKAPPEYAGKVLAGKDRTAAPAMAAACGLYLSKVVYPKPLGDGWASTDRSFRAEWPLLPVN